ncbi:MipA/OmpV family protein [Pontibacterium sp.]|uniref:MipA/OmpV family protein n=1 Tax=Pontibacterium sp. TaxID=2036026 RepID=UPI0035154CCE
MKKTTLGTALLAATVTASANAESTRDLQFGLGVGAAFSESIYTGVDDHNDAIPLIDLQYGNFFVKGLEAGYTLRENDRYSLVVSVAGDSLNGERDDSSALADMGDVDSGVNLKLSGKLNTDYGRLGLAIAQDISDEHDGTELTFSWGQPLHFNNLAVMPTVYASWMSDDLVNHYYGVSATQALPDRAQYEGEDGWRYGVKLAATYPLTKSWSVNGGVKAEWYGDEVTNSSIVEEDSALSGFVGVKYQF